MKCCMTWVWFSIQMIIVCLIGLLLKYVIISEGVPLRPLMVLFGISQSFAWLPCLKLVRKVKAYMLRGKLLLFFLISWIYFAYFPTQCEVLKNLSVILCVLSYTVWGTFWLRWILVCTLSQCSFSPSMSCSLTAWWVLVSQSWHIALFHRMQAFHWLWWVWTSQSKHTVLLDWSWRQCSLNEMEFGELTIFFSMEHEQLTECGTDRFWWVNQDIFFFFTEHELITDGDRFWWDSFDTLFFFSFLLSQNVSCLLILTDEVTLTPLFFCLFFYRVRAAPWVWWVLASRSWTCWDRTTPGLHEALPWVWFYCFWVRTPCLLCSPVHGSEGSWQDNLSGGEISDFE